MSFFEITKKHINKAFTENGDIAYQTTGSYCLDYFAIVGGMRENMTDALNLFLKSYYEDPLMTIKILFYVRDIRSGLGERDLFRYAFNVLCNMYPDVAKQLIKYIPEYGRYDDLLVCLDSVIHDDVIRFIGEKLKEDLENKKAGKQVSLLAKWLPSINTSSKDTRIYAQDIAASLGMKCVDYRKMLSYLRKDLIIENNLREKNYTFDYEKVSSGAMFKYRNAFLNNDNTRFNEYLEKLKLGTAKMNTKAIYPYEVIRALENGAGKKEWSSLDAIWKNFDRNEISSKTIVVRDGSGSMLDNRQVTASSVATSLAILFAEQLTSEFKDKFITFSSKPKLIEIKGKTIKEKYNFICKFDDYTNTNISLVYKLILDVYKDPKFKKEDALDRIIIISDMEFDCIKESRNSTFEVLKKEFAKHGFKLPEIVFWNVRARGIHFPTTNEQNIKLVSGASPKIIEMITKNQDVDGYQFMVQCLEKYSFLNEIKF